MSHIYPQILYWYCVHFSISFGGAFLGQWAAIIDVLPSYGDSSVLIELVICAFIYRYKLLCIIASILLRRNRHKLQPRLFTKHGTTHYRVWFVFTCDVVRCCLLSDRLLRYGHASACCRPCYWAPAVGAEYYIINAKITSQEKLSGFIV